MDDENETNTLLGNKIRDALSGVPAEVQDFMWSDEYKIILDTIQKTLLLTEQEKDLMKYGSYQLLLGLKNMEDLSKEWLTAGMKPDTVIKVLYVINQEILTRAQYITEYFTNNPDDSDENNTDQSIVSSRFTSPAPLATLTDRLKQASIAIPSKREYVGGQKTSPDSPVTTEPVPTNESPVSKPTIDPYHESIGE